MLCGRRIALLLVLALATCTSTVLANKGPNQQIVFTNKSSVQVGVTTDANSSAILAALAAQSQSAFQMAGGVILTPGATASFGVQVGTYNLGATNWSAANTGVVLTQVPLSQSVAANQTVNVYVHGTATSTGVVLSMDNTP